MRIFNIIGLIFMGVSLSMIADYFLKVSNFSNYRYLAVGALFYASAAIPVAAVFRTAQFGVVFIIWEAMVVSLALVMGAVLFKEPMTGLKFVALLFAFATIILGYFATK